MTNSTAQSTGYQIIKDDFENLSMALKANNEYVYSLFMRSLTKAQNEGLWYDHCYKPTQETADAVCDLLRGFVSGIDEQLMAAVEASYADAQMHLEVLQHFEQDKPEILLWQEFQQATQVDEFQDNLNMYRNEI